MRTERRLWLLQQPRSGGGMFPNRQLCFSLVALELVAPFGLNLILNLESSDMCCWTEMVTMIGLGGHFLRPVGIEGAIAGFFLIAQLEWPTSITGIHVCNQRRTVRNEICYRFGVAP